VGQDPQALALRAVPSRLRQRLGRIAGSLVLRRWPWPLWRLRDGGTLPIGPERFWFHGIADPEHLWWAQTTRRREWEQPMIRELARALGEGDVFVDLGAYVGGYTLLASRLVGPHGKVVAFEPDPAARRLLERNLASNGAANVTVVPFAVGRDAGSVRFVGSGDSVGRIDPEGELEVEQVSLDDFCRERDLRPTVMKVDIEGGEADALDGSAVVAALRELVLEVHEPQLRERGVDVGGFLERLGEHRPIEPPDSGNYAVVVEPRVAT
jgi:FkbM family methyltransferase